MTTEPPGDPAGNPPGQASGEQAPHPTGSGPAQPPEPTDPGPTYASAPAPYADYGQPLPAPAGATFDEGGEEPPSSLRERSLFVVAAALAGVALGIVGGYIWSVVADPPVGLLTDRGVFLTSEQAYDQQVVVTLWFLIIGAGLAALAGVVIGLLGRRHGVTVVVAVLVMCAVACALSAWLGIEVFGPDPKAQVAASAVGDPITAALDISTKIAYLGWPIGGLLGVLVAVSTWSRPKVPTPTWASSSVSPH